MKSGQPLDLKPRAPHFKLAATRNLNQGSLFWAAQAKDLRFDSWWLLLSSVLLYTTKHVWQSQVEIKHYSAAYLLRSKHCCAELPLRAGLVHSFDAWIPDKSACIWAPTLYGSSVLQCFKRGKVVEKVTVISTQNCHMFFIYSYNKIFIVTASSTVSQSVSQILTTDSV